jgi:hypothetical protein
VQQDERGREGDEGGMAVRAALVAHLQGSKPGLEHGFVSSKQGLDGLCR